MATSLGRSRLVEIDDSVLAERKSEGARTNRGWIIGTRDTRGPVEIVDSVLDAALVIIATIAQHEDARFSPLVSHTVRCIRCCPNWNCTG